MQSGPLQALMKPLMPVCMMLACSACVATPPIEAPRTACSSLLPNEWANGVAGAPLPGAREVGEWIAFGAAQTGQLDKANDRYNAAIGIVARCEARDREAVKQSKKRILGFL